MPYVPKFKSNSSSTSGLAKWASGTFYEAGNVIYLDSSGTSTGYLSGIFVCTSSHTSSTFDSDVSKWTALTSAYLHTQPVSSAIWSVVHGLLRKPSVTLADENGFLIEGSVEHTSLTTLTVRFNTAQKGTAYCV